MIVRISVFILLHWYLKLFWDRNLSSKLFLARWYPAKLCQVRNTVKTQKLTTHNSANTLAKEEITSIDEL